jgi:protein SCO1/2
MRRLLLDPRFPPSLVAAAFVWGAAVVAFLRFGPGRWEWTDALLVACFGWDAATRHYRLDTVLLALLQPPLFAAVVAAFYADELRGVLRAPRGRLFLLAPALFAGLAAYLLVGTAVSASGVPPGRTAPLRQSTAAPAFDLVDHRGDRVTAVGLRGRPTVLTFVYADCHATCPTLVGRLKALEARAAADTRFVTLTLDPERDTPAALAAHAARWGLGSRWHLLTGEPAAVQSVLAAFGVQWTRLPDGEIAHENVVLLLDRAGRVAFTYRGLAQPAERLAADLARLAAERG